MPTPSIDLADIQAAVATLRSGGVVAFPTETVFGLGALISNEHAVSCLFDLKRRPRSQALLAHVNNVEMARTLVADWPDRAESLAHRFWPGPLTMVLPKSNLIPDVVTGDGPTIGLRCPNHPVALALIDALGEAVAATSVNRHGQPPLTKPEEIRSAFPSDLVYTMKNTGPAAGGTPSTVLLLGSTAENDRIVRPGPISAHECGLSHRRP